MWDGCPNLRLIPTAGPPKCERSYRCGVTKSDLWGNVALPVVHAMKKEQQMHRMVQHVAILSLRVLYAHGCSSFLVP